MTALHVVYRSTAKGNAKPRPAFFDKLVCLRSVVHAAEFAGDVELVFLNDGTITDERGDLMAASGEIVEGSFDVQTSYWAALRLATSRDWADDDLVYLCEDDHLHHPHALQVLREAANEVDADYFGLYGSVDGRLPTGEPLPAQYPVPETWRPSTNDVVAGGHRWRRTLSTTSTFAARVGALRADLPIHLVGHRTLGHEGSHDHPISLAVQGYQPFPWARTLRVALRGDEPLVRRLKLATWEVVMNLRAMRASRHHREILGAVPALACHLELGYLAAGVDWERIAAGIRELDVVDLRTPPPQSESTVESRASTPSSASIDDTSAT